jgi:quinol-cytochrome oxidoreductase complex cytochrome b subunit
VRSRRLVIGFGGLVALDLLVLLATGIHLAFRYRPEPGASGTTLLEVSSTLHAITAWGALVLVVIAVVNAAVWLPTARRRVSLWLGGLVAVCSAGYGIVTGARLAWDQLALSAVTDGNSVPVGVVGLPDTVKFLIVGHNEVSPGTYSGRVWVHVLVVPAVFAIGIVLVGVACTRLRSVPAPDAHDPEGIPV